MHKYAFHQTVRHDVRPEATLLGPARSDMCPDLGPARQRASEAAR
jgi:hypothetical protein